MRTYPVMARNRLLAAWPAANALGFALCVGWLGTHLSSLADAVSLATLPMWSMLCVGLVWGVLQWLVLRHWLGIISLWWIGASACGWLLSLPLVTMALGAMPRSTQDMLSFATELGWGGPVAWRMILGYFAGSMILAFFGMFAGLFMVLPQCLGLLMSGRTRGWAGSWLGNAVWGWTSGIVLTGCGLMLVLAFLEAVFGGALLLPTWLIFASLGAGTGLLYGLFTQFELIDYAQRRSLSLVHE